MESRKDIKAIGFGFPKFILYGICKLECCFLDCLFSVGGLLVFLYAFVQFPDLSLPLPQILTHCFIIIIIIPMRRSVYALYKVI